MRLVQCIFFLFLVGVNLPAHAQSDSNSYTEEFIYGIKKSTNGGLISGVIGKWGKAVNPKLFRTIGLEIVNVKHPKERRFSTGAGGSYIVGKSNYLYAIRTQYGYDKILFKKASQQGVQINAVAAIGPTIGLLVPYYVEVQAGQGSISIPFDPEDQGTNILRSGAVFDGLSQAKIKPGLNLKGALSFEFGTFKNSISGFEVGFMVEAYPSEIKLISAQEVNNRSVFTSVYISLIYGSRR